jgi:glycosyltransferase involved in cell wall biosynthesis
MRLSAVLITRNEEDRIEEAIVSVAFVDEILVLDSGSTDSTVAKARALGATVLVTDWPGFVQQKNRAWEQASGEWILSLDADERISPELQASIQQALQSPSDYAGFCFNRRNFWLGHRLKGGGWYHAHTRLARKDKARWEGQNPHDQLIVMGPVGFLTGDLLHIPYRNLSEHLSTIDRYTRVAAQELQASGKTGNWVDVWLRPFWRFFSAFILKAGFKDGIVGLILAILHALYGALKYARAQGKIPL